MSEREVQPGEDGLCLHDEVEVPALCEHLNGALLVARVLAVPTLHRLRPPLQGHRLASMTSRQPHQSPFLIRQ